MVGEQGVSCQLLGYGTGAFRHFSRSYIPPQGPEHGADINPPVVIKLVVFHGNNGILHQLRDLVQADRYPVFQKEPGDFVAINIIDDRRGFRLGRIGNAGAEDESCQCAGDRLAKTITATTVQGRLIPVRRAILSLSDARNASRLNSGGAPRAFCSDHFIIT